MTATDNNRPGCPDCGGPLVIARSRIRNNVRSRELRCKFCGYQLKDHPEPDPGDPNCEHCREYLGPDAAHPCRFGFPEVLDEGPSFARDCSVFVVKG